MLNHHTDAILRTLVEQYIRTAVPVASESIARQSPIKVSPATVRNKMAELEETGYIVRPHISSGGMPSSKGYRFYVESLDNGLEPSIRLQELVRNRFGEAAQNIEVWMEVAASILSELSENMAVVTYPKAPSPRIKQIQLVLIQELMALLVVVFPEARLRKYFVTLDDLYSQNELTLVANKLNEMYGGMGYTEILETPADLTPFEESVRQNTLTILKEDDSESIADHAVDGIRLLLSQPEFLHEGKAQQIIEIVEEKALVKDILTNQPEADGVVVRIGGENFDDNLNPFSVVVCRYGMPNEASGVVAVMGPQRMRYGNVISGVKFLSNLMGDLLYKIPNRRRHD